MDELQNMGLSTLPQTSQLNAGTVSIEVQRAIAEARGRIMVAKSCPRDVANCIEQIRQACRTKTLAEEAFYNFPRGGQTVEGPTIRLAEEMARCWGNMLYGMRELSQDNGESEYEVFCWDLETNTQSLQSFSVRHLRVTKSSTTKLTDPRDIYEAGANAGARRLRSRILAVIPKWFQNIAVEECIATIAGTNNAGSSALSLVDKLRIVFEKFEFFQVSLSQLEAYVGKPMTSFKDEDLATLVGVYNALKDGVKTAEDYFGAGNKADAPESTDDLNKAIANEAAKPKDEKPKKPKPEKPAAKEEPKPEAEKPQPPAEGTGAEGEDPELM